MRLPPASAGFAHRPGITLIEVLLSMAIFLLAIIPIGVLFDMGTNNALESMLVADGTRLAQSKMAEVEAGVIPVASGGGGTVEDEPSWTWSAESVPAGLPNLYSVTVTLSHDLRGKKLDVTLTQMIYDPLQMGTGAQIPKPEAATGGTTP